MFKDKVLEHHEANMNEISTLMPVINAVANKNLKDKHWRKIYEKLEQPFPANANSEIKLNELLQYRIS